MTSFFLKAKHWLLFLLMFGIPLIFQFGMMIMMFSTINATGQPDPTFMFDMMAYFPVIMLIYMGLLFGWFWSIAIGLQPKVPKSIVMKTKKFKIFFFIPVLYITFLMLFMANMFTGFDPMNSEPSGFLFPGVIAIILPLHLLSMFSIFYCIYFCAKTLKTILLEREVSFGEFAGEFFMLWFWPIGIWILQPKINTMVNSTTKSDGGLEIL